MERSELNVAKLDELWTPADVEKLLVSCRLESKCVDERAPLHPFGLGEQPRVSVHGHVAFLRTVRSGSREYRIEQWLLRAGAATPERLLDGEEPPQGHGRLGVEWSPDGRWLAASTHCGGRVCLEVLDLRARAQGYRRLAEIAEAQVSWSPDSGSLAFLRQLPDRPKAVARVKVSTGAVSDVLTPPPLCSYQSVAWSTGGLATLLRCSRGGKAGAASELVIYDVR
jgi:hypothetical protein